MTCYFDAVVSEVVVDQEDWAESASLLVQPGAMRGYALLALEAARGDTIPLFMDPDPES